MSRSAAGLADALLADRYRLVERIAAGGMGEVWRADDLLLGRVVAVKALKAEFLDDEDFRARFRAEARHAGRLVHPGIASVFDFGETDHSAWLVMELVDGEPLSGLLRREGTLPVDRTLDLLAQTADALHAAHEAGVVHRDVKPGNLLVRRDGVLKVTDFGIASAADAVPLTRTGLVVGTAFYLSPEQASGRSGSPASDLYALGVVAYECLAGARPFPGENPIAVALAHVREEPPVLPVGIPAPVRELVRRALAKDPADRHADAAELAREARELRAALPPSAALPAASLPVEPPAAAREPGEDEQTRLLQRAAGLRTPGARARTSRQLVRVAAAVLLALAVALGLQEATRTPDVVPAAAPSPTDAGSPTPSVTASATRPAAPAPPQQVAVDPASYRGKPAEQVRAALAGLGLDPRLAYDGDGAKIGTVTDVEPAGAVTVGSAVLVHVVPTLAPAPAQVAPVPAPAPTGLDRGNAGKGKGRGKK